MKKRVILISILIIFLIITGVSAYFIYFQEPVQNQEDINNPCTGLTDSYEADFSSVKPILEQNEMIQSVPDSGKISIKFYHDKDNCRFIDKAFMLSSGKVTEENPACDIDLFIHSKYAEQITQENICQIISQARANGELYQNLNVGKASLLIKYSSLLKYKDCLGL